MEVVLAALLALLAGARSQDHGDSGLASGLRLVRSAYHQCQQGGHLLACLQLRALKVADRALGAERIPLLDGVELVRTNEVAVPRGEGLAPLDEEVFKRDPNKFGSMMLDRAARFLDTHSLRIDVPRFLEVDAAVSENEIGEGRQKLKKKNKGMGMMLMMAGMMKAGLMALGMKAVALLAGKALLVAKVALVLAAVLGLSKLLGGGGGGGGGGTTYEVVKHPHVTYAHTHSSSHDLHGGGGGDFGGGGGYFETSGGGGGGGGHHGRSLSGGGDPHSLAYRGHAAAAGNASKTS